MGLNKKAARREVRRKLNLAAPQRFFVGRFRGYLDALSMAHGSLHMVTETGIFCIKSECVTTYLEIPRKLRKVHLVQMVKWREQQKEKVQ